MAIWTVKYANWLNMIVESTVLSQNEGNNTSTIRTVVKLKSTSSSSNNVFDNDTQSLSVLVDGSSAGSRTFTYNLSALAEVTLATYDKVVTHNSDGRKTARIQVSASGGGNSASIDQNLALPRIPRTSSFSLSGTAGSLGNSVTITISKASSSFTHTVKHQTAGQVTTVATKTTSSSVAYTIPTSLASKIPNSTSSSGSIIVETYSGNTLIGSTSRNFTTRIPDNASYKPRIDSVTVVEGVANVKTKIGSFVKGLSKFKIDVTRTAMGGATIAQTTIEANFGESHSGTVSATTGFLRNSGSNTVRVRVVDSRGRETVWTNSYTVLDYQSPTIGSFSAWRKNGLSSTVSVSRKGNLWGLGGKNTSTIYIAYRERGATAWSSSYNTSTTNNSFDLTHDLPTTFSPGKSYELRLLVEDFFSRVSQVVAIPTARFPLTMSALGIAINKVWERGAFEVEGESFFSGDVTMNSPTNPNNEIKLVSTTSYGNAGIDIKAIHANQPTTYIDFYTSGLGAAADNRIQASEGTSANFQGRMQVFTGTLDIISNAVRHNGVNMVSTGTNDGGTWYRFSNGLQLFYKNVPHTFAVNISGGGMYRGPLIQMNFPVSFRTPPVVIVSPDGGGPIWFAENAITGNAANGYFQSYSIRNISNKRYMYLAIGEWS